VEASDKIYAQVALPPGKEKGKKNEWKAGKIRK
jgi:hypothetical protein